MKQLKNVNVIMYRNPANPVFLILKSSGKKGSIIWQGVTGKIEDTDKSHKATVVRELSEEIGIDVTDDKITGPIHEFEYITERKGYEGTYAHQYCFSCELPKESKVTLSHEHQDYIWLSFNEAIQLIDYDNPKKAMQITYNNLKSYIKEK